MWPHCLVENTWLCLQLTRLLAFCHVFKTSFLWWEEYYCWRTWHEFGMVLCRSGVGTQWSGYRNQSLEKWLPKFPTNSEVVFAAVLDDGSKHAWYSHHIHPKTTHTVCFLYKLCLQRLVLFLFPILPELFALPMSRALFPFCIPQKYPESPT